MLKNKNFDFGFIYFAGKIQLKTSKTHKDKFERNQTDIFSVEAVDIGSLKKIR